MLLEQQEVPEPATTFCFAIFESVAAFQALMPNSAWQSDHSCGHDRWRHGTQGTISGIVVLRVVQVLLISESCRMSSTRPAVR